MGYPRGKWGKKFLAPVAVNQKFDNLLHYWRFHEANYPDLAKMVYDMYSIPAMSAEYKRVFSSTKLLTTDCQA